MQYIRGGQNKVDSPPPLPEPKVISEVGRKQGRRGGPIIHSLWAVDYIIGGDCYVEVARQGWLRGKNTVHLYAPGTEYFEGPGTSTHVASRYVVFGPEKFTPLENLLAGKNFLSFLDPAGIVADVLEKMVTLVELKGPPLATWGLLMELIGYLLSSEVAEDGQRILVPFSSGEKSQFVQQVNRILQEDLATKLTVAQMAKKLHVSPSTLSHRYREETGLSPYRARIIYRLKMAGELLRYRDKTLEEIAHEVGFANASHLSGAFKEHFGCAPAEYREKLWKKS